MAANRRGTERIGIVGAVAAFAVAVLMVSYPAVATSTPATSAMNLPPPPPLGERIILTSTSGQFWESSGGAARTGPASGTMTLTVVENKAASSVNQYNLTVAGWVNLGLLNTLILHIPLTGGSAYMNVLQTVIVGSGTVSGGTFTFRALSVSPTTIPIRQLNFSLLSINLHIGGSHYNVLLHVKTTVVVPVV